MPPEPLPWDRKKHERSAGHYGSYRDFSPRWAGGSSEFRRPSGHGKQGGWHLFADESGYGYGPSRSNDRMQENNNGRPLFSRGDGKYGRSGRDNYRGPSGQRDWRAHSWDMSNGSTNGPGRPCDVSNDQRSVDDMLICPPPHPPNSDFVNTWDQLPLRQQHGTNEDGGNVLGSGQRGDKDNSLDWKPLKWARTGSSSSRGSGYSHSSSSKNLGAVKADGGKTEVIPKNGTPIRSTSVDVTAARATSVTLSDETMSRKKPRLKWGEGLAKFEKKIVEGPETSVTRDDTTLFTNSVEPVHSPSSSLPDKSPRQMVFPECVSPPSSLAFSSSPGIEEKGFCKAVSVDNDATNLCGSPSVDFQGRDELSFNLEKLDMGSIPNLGSSLIELIQSEGLCLVDSCFEKSTGLNKLLVWKGDALKALETTETEIDILENELKLLKSDSKSKLCSPSLSDSRAVSSDAVACSEQGNLCRDDQRRPASNMNEAADEIASPDDAFEDGRAKDDGIDSPRTATSKFVEPVLSVRTSSDMVECIQHSDVAATESSSLMIEKESALAACNVSIMRCNGNTLLSATNSSVEDGYSHICTAILASNKESASSAGEEFNRLLPRDPYSVDHSGVANILAGKTDALVMKTFLTRRHLMKFKEKMVVLKFKALQHLWREDMQLLSVKKFKTKSQKKFESSLRPVHNMHKKHRSSSRVRICSSGSMSLVLSPEMLNFTRKLLADCSVKVYRDNSRMPIQILDNSERKVSKFISGNGLVEDPFAVERERAMINPWSSEEREVFIDKLAICGKDFKKIASFLEHKTTADCVEFYYKNHKSDSFGKVKKNKQSKSLTNYLMSSGKKWNCEMSTAPLDIFGADWERGSKKVSSSKIFIRGYNKCKLLQGDNGDSERLNNYDVLVNERETAAADALAGISGSMSSCITTSADHALKRATTDRRPSTSDVTQNVNEETCSDDSCGEMVPADWTDEERTAFVRAVTLYGKDFAFISRCVRTRSQDQCKVFFSKARKCLGLDQILSGIGALGPSFCEDANEGDGSDMEDAIVVGSEEIPSKLDLHPPPIISDGGVSDEKDVAGAIEEEENLMTVDTVVPDGEVINGFGRTSVSMNGQAVAIESDVPEGERDCQIKGSAVDSLDSGLSKLVSVVEAEALRDIPVERCSNSTSEQARDLNTTKEVEQHLPLDMGSSSDDGPNITQRQVEVNSVENSLSMQSDKQVIGNQLVAEGSCLGNSNNSEVTELPLVSQDASDQPGSSTNTSRNGDVKLFGKILSNPVSEKRTSSSSSSSTLKCNGDHREDALLNLDKNESAAISSYGFWDGSRIQTGLTLLPDSTVLLAKYPAAFTNCQGPKNIEGSLNGVASSNALLDFQRYISMEGSKKVEDAVSDPAATAMKMHFAKADQNGK